MYFDTSYIAKFYLNEPESERVRKIVKKADSVHSTVWAIAEFHAVLHRHVRKDALSFGQARDLATRFLEHVDDGLWNLVPIHDGLLRRTSILLVSAPHNLFIRTADAVHLTTAQEIGEREVWTNDRHMLAAAHYFGLSGRSV